MGKGFTLVELAIVLVIIGLLVGSLIAGQELIKQARLNKIIAEYTDIKRSIDTFRAKFNALPGDFNKATSFWGSISGSCNTVAGNSTETCNGNGNGELTYDNAYEAWRAWEHLSNAGVIGVEYTGVKTTTCSMGDRCYVPGSNVPASNIVNAVWAFFNVSAASAYDWTGKDKKRDVIAFGSVVGDGISGGGVGWPGHWYNGVLTTEEQYSVDTKIDDGRPYTGIIVDITSATFTPGCATSDVYTATTATYALTNTGKRCLMLIDYN